MGNCTGIYPVISGISFIYIQTGTGKKTGIWKYIKGEYIRLNDISYDTLCGEGAQFLQRNVIHFLRYKCIIRSFDAFVNPGRTAFHAKKWI